MTWFRLDRRTRATPPAQIVGVFLVCVLVGSLASEKAHAQAFGRSASKFYPDSSEAAEALLRNAANHAKAGEWSEAVAIYQRVIDQFDQKVARLPRDLPAPQAEGLEAEAEAEDVAGLELDGDFTLYVDLRAYCQRTLAALPPEGLAVYRARRDPQAELWFQEGRERRDPAILRRIVDEAFCTSWGDDALELLGDLAFQDGRFAEAEAMYRRLVPDSPDDPMNFPHPDPSIDESRVEAKKILARAAKGETSEIAATIEAFATRRPGAEGTIAGRKGPLAESLAAALRDDALAPTAQEDARWPTFGGSPMRGKVLAEPIDVGSLQWRAPLEKITAARGALGFRPGGPGSAPPPDRLLGYHPIVLGDQVLVCDGSRIQAFNLDDRPDRPSSDSAVARPAWTFQAEGEDAGPQARMAFWTAPRYTLTAVGRRIYARMGLTIPGLPGLARFPAQGPGGQNQAIRGGSYLVALDRDRPGDKKVWLRRSSELTLPDRPEDAQNLGANFEGTPVADARAVYAAVTVRRELTATYVASFDADDGSLRWIRYLGAAASENDAFPGIGMNGMTSGDSGSRLLSLDGPTLYYQTNLGAVTALDAETGSIHWVATYPRHEVGRRSSGVERDLNPAVVHEGTVFIAPSDASAIFAFDALTGRLRWKTDSIPQDVKIMHLLGVAKGRLVATGDRVLLFDVRDGRLLHAWPDTGGREGFGRGLLAGGRIYWPTRTEIHVLDQATASLAAPPIRLAETYRTTGGNLAAGDGYLVVAQNDGLMVFCQNSRLIERYRQEIVLRPDDAASHYRLARAAEAVEDVELALGSYQAAARHAGPSETLDGEPLIHAARDHEFRLLLRLASDLRRDQKPDEAAARLESAAEIAREPRDRLRARLYLAETLTTLNRPTDAVEVLQGLLNENGLERLAVPADDGRRAVRADLFIGDLLATVVREHGRASYAKYDRLARDLLTTGRRDQDARALAEAARAFPAAETVPDALLALGAALEGEDRPADAASAYKRLLALTAADDVDRASALRRLARVYQSQGFLVPARDAYIRLQNQFAGVPIPTDDDDGQGIDAAESASAALARPLLASVVADRPRPPTPSPLVRRWTWQGGDSADAASPLSAVGLPPSTEVGRTFLADGLSLSALNPDQGEICWTTKLGGRVVWVGYLADKLVAATSHRILALDARTGAIRWRFGPETEPETTIEPDPFGRKVDLRTVRAEIQVDAAEELPPSPAKVVLHGFQIVGGRLFLLRGDEELLAIDGDSGLVDWSFTGRDGGVAPHVWIGPNRLILQTDQPHEILVLETETGRNVSRRPLDEGESLQREPAPLGDDHAIVVTDRRTVKKLDLARGEFDWAFRQSAELPIHGAPRPLVDEERLLVIHDGRTLIRLDPATGAPRWTASLGMEDLGERPDAVALDERRFYWAGGRLLRALSLENGRTEWSHPLVGPRPVRWSITLSDRAILSYPNTTSPADDPIEPLPVVVRRQVDGGLIQRVMLPTAVDGVALRLGPQGAVVSTPHSLWALGDRSLARVEPAAERRHP